MKSLFLFLITHLFLYANPIKKHLEQAQKGDFVVFEEGKHLFLLSVFETDPHLIIEEYSVPTIERDKITSWQDWIYQQDPIPTSHLIYEIDLQRDLCLECYSFTKGAFLQPNDSFIFFRLTKLPFQQLQDHQRKKIGPPPADGEEDRRSLWNPTLYFEGKKVDRPKYNVFHARWPEDTSSFSNAEIELFYSARQKFAFPVCLQLKGSHMRAFARALDAGKNLSSTASFFPRRKPIILSSKGKKIKLVIPSYYYPFKIYTDAACQKEIPFVEKEISEQTFLLHFEENYTKLYLKPSHYPHLRAELRL